MKFTLVGPLPPYRGGIAHHTARLAQGIRQAGHDLQVISFRSQYPSFLYPGTRQKDPVRHPRQVPAPAAYMLSPLNPLSWRQTAQSILRFCPQMIVLQWWLPFWAPAYASLASRLRRAGIPLVFLVHNALPHERHWLDRQLARMALGKGDAFIVHAPAEARRLKEVLSLEQPAVVIPHPLYDQFGPRLSRLPARQRLGLPLDAPLLLFFGFIRPYKGLHVLIDALALLPGISRPHLLVAGEFWEDPRPYHRLVARLGLEDHVHFISHYIPDEDVAALFSAADLFAAPYTQGTQSGALRIAMAYGLPILASTAAAPDTSYPLLQVFPPGDACSLAAGIRRWLEDPPPPIASPPGREGWQKLVTVLVEFTTGMQR